MGMDHAAVGTTIDFLLIDVATGEEFWFEVEIGWEGNSSVGFLYVTDVPLGNYELCESVPAGYIGYAVPWDDDPDQEISDNCVAFTVGIEQENLLFANVPDEVEELPDTGVGVTASPAPGTWVPVLLVSALLLVTAGRGLRLVTGR